MGGRLGSIDWILLLLLSYWDQDRAQIYDVRAFFLSFQLLAGAAASEWGQFQEALSGRMGRVPGDTAGVGLLYNTLYTANV